MTKNTKTLLFIGVLGVGAYMLLKPKPKASILGIGKAKRRRRVMQSVYGQQYAQQYANTFPSFMFR